MKQFAKLFIVVNHGDYLGTYGKSNNSCFLHHYQYYKLKFLLVGQDVCLKKIPHWIRTEYNRGLFI